MNKVQATFIALPIVSLAIGLVLAASCMSFEGPRDRRVAGDAGDTSVSREEIAELRADNDMLLDHLCSADPTFYRCTGD